MRFKFIRETGTYVDIYLMSLSETESNHRMPCAGAFFES